MTSRVRYRFSVEAQGKRREVVLRRPVRREVGACGKTSADANPDPQPRPASSLARRLALANYVERCIEAGVIDSYTEAARKLGITRARMTQVMDLLLLPVVEQEALLTP